MSPIVKPPSGILILGAGTFALEASDLAEELGLIVMGYAVDVPVPGELNGLPVWQIADAPLLPAVCAIVSPLRRRLVEKAEARGFQFIRLVHPSASVSHYASVGQGCVVGRLAAVGRGAHLSSHVIVNRGALVGHDVHVGKFSTLGPGANLAGCVQIGEGVIIGMGACVLEKLTVGSDATVGTGSVVVQNVPVGETWWGMPAGRVR